MFILLIITNRSPTQKRPKRISAYTESTGLIRASISHSTLSDDNLIEKKKSSRSKKDKKVKDEKESKDEKDKDK